jgi:hypothetical protein
MSPKSIHSFTKEFWRNLEGGREGGKYLEYKHKVNLPRKSTLGTVTGWQQPPSPNPSVREQKNGVQGLDVQVSTGRPEAIYIWSRYMDPMYLGSGMGCITRSNPVAWAWRIGSKGNKKESFCSYYRQLKLHLDASCGEDHSHQKCHLALHRYIHTYIHTSLPLFVSGVFASFCLLGFVPYSRTENV